MNELEKILLGLNPKNPESRAQITRLYQLIDEACDKNEITVGEWRILLDKIAKLRETNRFKDSN